ncbi:phospholipase B1, membrane-associated [Psammomys obesus]|uniref:phospholipase B1, membrane-associated n=1 Tax=Psammomys obesus TaxID=48139 RepID=UPI00245322E3|nr:phospholipase B1, membrane-associated [Psammomys obesus]
MPPAKILTKRRTSSLARETGSGKLGKCDHRQLQTLKSFPFPCKPKKLEWSVPSKSVHSLRPSDIKHVAAIGNLETFPGSGMVDVEKLQSIKNEPQHVCMGVMTVLSDIIRHYNPSVLMPTCSPGRSGAAHGTDEDLWIQAKQLVRSLKENPQLDYENDWKLVTMFFSNPSQCHLCPSDEQKRQLMRHMEKLSGILDFLHQEVPRAFVNVVDLSEVLTMAHQHQETGLSPAPELCNCSEDSTKLSKAIMQWSYQDSWENLLASSKFNKHESFAVVFQPFFYEIESASEKSSPQDPTTLALRLWNSMIEPVGRKDEPLDGTEQKTMKCPSQESPYLFTYRNSNYQAKRLKPIGKLQVREGTVFSCSDKDPSDTVPTTVHRLRPADIKVIGALGDSITAGNGAGSRPGDVLDVLTQYRGLSWSVGGDEDIRTVTTLSNILREFNPSLKGFSIGTGKENTVKASFNQAVAGAKSDGLAAQAQKLVSLMKADKTINFQEDWKIITVFIGGNDLCSSCNNQLHFSPQNFTENIKKALDILHAELPRTFVNMVEMIEIIALRELYKETQVSCPRLILRNLCPCVLKFDDNSAEFAALVERNRQYQKETEKLIESRRYDTRDDFTVVLQPFFENVAMPRTPEGLPDSSFFAPDCFHFNVKAHARSAIALWKNMLEPVGHKTRQQNFEDKAPIVCPNQTLPFLSTYKNSKQGYGTLMLCKDKAPSASPPTSVHALRPADIQVVAALGDSLTAGNGISSQEGDLSDVATQYRGLSYSAGGDESLEKVTTLPNILREFNGNLTGYAVGTGDSNSTNAFLNQAVPRAKAENLASQVQTLVQRMKSDHRVNFRQDWKVITVMIGASDLCDFCTDSNLYSAANFLDHLRNALDILHREVPRALVNLVDFMNPGIIRQVFLKNPDKCPVHQASVLCNCVLTPGKNSPELARLEAFAQSYQSSMLQLVESGRYDTREDFSVVLQPFFLNTRLPVLEDGHPDTSFFAPDCILPNQKFHSQLSRALWVNMLEPLGKKTDTLDLKAFIAMACPTQDEPFLRTFRNSNYTYPTKPAIENWGSDFLCTEQSPSSSVPTSAHKLRPADIKVVAALGDALTIATGARPSETNNQNTPWRGLSWSTGGDGTLDIHTTLPNILKKFNPSILGFSTGTLEETAGLNMAEEGARAQDMPAQAQALVERMRSTPTINLEEDWKLVTLFIGSNDLCHYCENPENHSTEEYVKHVQRALDILYEELPRVFINVVEVMELAGLHEGEGGKCAMPLAVQNNCSCLKHFQSPTAMQKLKKVNWDLQSGLSALSCQHQYTQREDFAVVSQPFFRNTLVPLNERGGMDLTFFSEDCLHFSERGHAEMAIGLWNNMLEPVGRKTTSNNFTYSRTKLKCPSPASPFLYTLRNSQLLPDQAEETSKVLYWPVLVAAIGGLVVGILGVMLWRTMRHSRKGDLPANPNTAAF